MRVITLIHGLLLPVLLSACGSTLKVEDLDGDGYSPADGDCWDAVEGPAGTSVGGADIHPDAEELWYDGVDQNCDGKWDYDQDGDSWDGNADGTGEDCDDEDPSAHPGGDDVWYDGVDADCGGEDDFDQDGDGSPGNAEGTGEDCDDLDAQVGPEAIETWYDGTDQDCDGNDTDQDGDGYPYTEDCDDEDPVRFPDFTIEEIWYNGLDENCDGNDGDQDGDGYVSDEYAAELDWAAFSGHLGAGDCWDDPHEVPYGFDPINDFDVRTAEEVGPETEETWYDGIDQDCDGASDFDQDGDGYNTEFYPDRDGISGDDCIDGSELDDENPGGLAPFDVNPDSAETWYDGTDQDCALDDDYDQDMDGYQASGYGVGSDDDCEDAQPDINPGAREDCSTSTDDDCDDDTNDVGAFGCTTYFVDADSDTYGTGSGACMCEATPEYGVENDDDCDDTSATVNPAATEGVGDEVDQDCDGSERCYLDYDNDGYRLDTTKVSADTDCDDSREALATDPDDDCDDEDATINPGETETAGDEIDQSCDGSETCYVDADDDGYRTTSTVSSADEDCSDSGEARSSETSGDCDDADDEINPGETEITGDEVDQNCDDKETCYADADNDGYRATSTKTSSDEDCRDSGEATSSEPSGDCDDTSSSANPGATEITGDEFDQNCDDKEVCYVDADRDGYRTTSTVTSTDEDCDDSGEAASSYPDDDCDDADELSYPGASETCEDDVVNDCDGTELDALQACGWDADYTMTSADARRAGGAASDLSGTRVAFAGDTDGDGDDELLIAATGASSSAGRVYVVSGPPAGSSSLSSSSYYSRRYTGEATSDLLGTGLASGLDTDNDGYDDLLLGAPYNNSGGSDAGAAYLLSGPLPSTATLSSVVYDAMMTGVATTDLAGVAVAGVGDVDEDGYDDVLIGAERSDTYKTNGGEAYLLSGPLTSGGLSSAAWCSWGGSFTSEFVGTALASGDIDGDGAPDLLFGVPNAAVGTTATRRGKVWLALGPPVADGELSSVADLELRGAADDDEAGASITAADIDGDGADDIVVGAPGVDSGASNGGAVYVVLGGSSLPSSTLTLSSSDVVLTGIAASDAAGTTVAAADLSGDGYAELMVGEPEADEDGTDSGGVYLLFGSITGSYSLSAADVTFSGQYSGDALGTGLAAGGDADGDGYPDLLMGAPGYDPSSIVDAGITYYFSGTGY